MELTSQFKLEDILESPNLAAQMSAEDLVTIGNRVVADYEMDERTRAPWAERMKTALDLAMQVAEKKNFPWPNASNVKFPLLTIAALQYHARAYPTLIPGTDVVECKVYGDDEGGERHERAERISAHMSYQVLEEDEAWEEQTDKVLISMPIIGCAFKKSYFDPIKGHNVSEFVSAKNFVVSYYTKSLATTPRMTHIIPDLSANDYYERIARGVYVELKDGTPKSPQPASQSTLDQAQDNAQGLIRPSDDLDAPILTLEQHRYLDLDGDGYQEPYVITVRHDTKQVMRIVARFFEDSIKRNRKGKMICIKPEQVFTKFSFIPSPDGGFYDLGFGMLLGTLNASIDTLINQLIDAGTMANTGGGFLGRGVKVRGGNYAFGPHEWKRVDSPGDDLRKNVVPLEVREPSQVLFTLLSLLIEYGERLAGATDPMVGVNPGQNTPAATSQMMVEQGSKIFSGLFKRTWRSLKEEFKKLYRLNQLFLDEETGYDNLSTGEPATISRRDYQEDPKGIRPVADPNVVSDAQRMMQAQAVSASAAAKPGLYNMYAVEKRFLKALKVQNIEEILPDPEGDNALPPPAPDVKLQIAQLNAEVKTQQMQLTMQIEAARLMKEAEESQAKIVKLKADAVKALAEAEGVESGHQVALIQSQVAAEEAKLDAATKSAKMLLDIAKLKKEAKETTSDEG